MCVYIHEGREVLLYVAALHTKNEYTSMEKKKGEKEGAVCVYREITRCCTRTVCVCVCGRWSDYLILYVQNASIVTEIRDR